MTNRTHTCKVRVGANVVTNDDYQPFLNCKGNPPIGDDNGVLYKQDHHMKSHLKSS